MRNEKKSPYIGPDELVSLKVYLRTLHSYQEKNPGLEAIDAQLYDQVINLTPKERYGTVSGTEVLADFKDGFYRSLEGGTADSYLAQASIDLSKVYVIKADEGELNPTQQIIRRNHQSDFINTVLQKVTAFARSPQILSVIDLLPTAIKLEYERLLRVKQETGGSLLHIGTASFTSEHKIAEEWGKLVGTGSRLPYADLAQELLNAKPTLEQHHTVDDALSLFNISADEKSGIPEFDPTARELTPEQGKALMEVFIARLQIPWTVEYSDAAGISVNSTVKKISFPRTRVLLAEELRYLIAHEFVHVLRGYNGSKQETMLLQSGLEGYLESEEGVATIAEMIVGEPFGSDRQRKIVARYLAIDLALQTKDVDGEIMPAYTIQEIYDVLTQQYAISARDAKDIVWRIIRGTSLKRDIVTISVEQPDGTVVEKQIPEVYTKDAVYFIGMQAIFDWMKKQLPQHQKLTPHLERQKDFTTESLLIIRKILEQHNLIGYPDAVTEGERAHDREELIAKMRQTTEVLSSQGREALFRLIDVLIIGKINLDTIQDPDWISILRPCQISYRQLFEPKRAD